MSLEHPRTTAPSSTIAAWSLFDFANTGFYAVIITLLFPIYFNETLAGGNESIWGRTLSASMLITALIGPLMGSIADAAKRKKLFLALFTIASVVATLGLYFAVPGALWYAIALVIIANVGFEGGTIFYDAFLPEISSERDYGRISGIGFATGYFGALVVLVAIFFGLPAEPTGGEMRTTFMLSGLFFGIFALPMFLVVKEDRSGRIEERHPVRAGIQRLHSTLTHLRSYRQVVRFLTAFFVYNDAILTVILFSGIFASTELGFDITQLVILFGIVQATALIGSLVFGQITNRIGARQALFITLAIWVGVVSWAYFVETASQFFMVAALAGTALGSSQSTSRALMALLTPMEKRTEFFGFYDGFFGKASAVIGPFIFGEIAEAIGIRVAMLIVGVMFLLGVILLARVEDVRADTEAVLSTGAP